MSFACAAGLLVFAMLVTRAIQVLYCFCLRGGVENEEGGNLLSVNMHLCLWHLLLYNIL